MAWRERNWCPASLPRSGNAEIAVNAGKDNQLPIIPRLLFKLHPASAGLGMLLERIGAPDHPYCSRSFPACSAFPLVSLTQLLVCYPVNREAHHFVCIGKAEFFFYVRPMGLDGLDAKIDLFRD